MTSLVDLLMSKNYLFSMALRLAYTKDQHKECFLLGEVKFSIVELGLSIH